jgi:hypothetical protein
MTTTTTTTTATTTREARCAARARERDDVYGRARRRRVSSRATARELTSAIINIT